MSGNKSLLLQDLSQKYCVQSEIQIVRYDKKKHSVENTAGFCSCKIIFIQINIYMHIQIVYAWIHISIFGSLTNLKKYVTIRSWVSAFFLSFLDTWLFLLKYELQWLWAITYKISVNYYIWLTFSIFFFAVLSLQFFDNNLKKLEDSLYCCHAFQQQQLS